MRVLIIEDDRRLARLIEQVLLDEHFTVATADSGHSGLDLALNGQFDVAVIDWMLPGRDGPSITRAIRAAGLATAVILLTARGQLEDKVDGFASGADDYLVKPFAFEELLARIRAVARRTGAAPTADELRNGDLVMDLTAHRVRRGVRTIDLTAREWSLLDYLMRHPGQTLSRQQILDAVWTLDAAVQPQMVDVYMSYLRRKLVAPGEHDPITTVRGLGYRLEDQRA
jgi:two-component system, OmpR family, response regulator